MCSPAKHADADDWQNQGSTRHSELGLRGAGASLQRVSELRQSLPHNVAAALYKMAVELLPPPASTSPEAAAAAAAGMGPDRRHKLVSMHMYSPVCNRHDRHVFGSMAMLQHCRHCNTARKHGCGHAAGRKGGSVCTTSHRSAAVLGGAAAEAGCHQLPARTAEWRLSPGSIHRSRVRHICNQRTTLGCSIL